MYLCSIVFGQSPNYFAWDKRTMFSYISVNINFMFRIFGRSPDSETGIAARDMCKHTLLMMAKGGMWDHVAKVLH